jgi:FtsH-binding integral membrane protein
MNQVLIQLYSCILAFILLCAAITNYSFKKGLFTCNKYILNTYLYILLTFNILALVVSTLEYKKISYELSPLQFFGLFIISIISIVAMHSITSKNIVLKHLVWVIFILSLTATFYPFYNLFKNNKHLVYSALTTTLVLFILLSGVAYLNPNLIKLSWGPVLLILLIAGILIELTTLLFFRNIKKDKLSNILKGLSYVFIVLFMVFILYDTKRLMLNAKKCVNADYIKESLGLFLDIFNIFVRILSLRVR